MKKFTHKSVTKVLSFVLVVLMLFISFSAGVSALSTGVLTTNEDKLTDNLKAHLETVGDDEYVYIYIWLLDYSPNAVYQLLSKRLGTVVTAETEEAYITNRISSKIELFKQNYAAANENIAQIQADVLSNESISAMSALSFRAQASIAEAMSDTEIETCISSGMSATEIISLSERSQYLSNYRQSRKTINNTINQNFVESLDSEQYTYISADPLLRIVRMQCKKSYIYTIANINVVEKIEHFDQTADPVEKTTPILEGGYHMYPQNLVDNITYTGAGINVGIIETGIFDAEAIHLKDKIIEKYSSEETSTDKEHATKVLSILGGTNVMYEKTGETYQGIAPNTTLFFAGEAMYWNTNILQANNIIPRFEWLIINKNCHAINISMGSNFNGQYTEYDQYLDLLVIDYRVVIVKSAGNEGDYSSNVTRPGVAYNVITVGNADCRAISEGFYFMHSSSSYEEYENSETLFCLSNKPDLVASGTNIYMMDASQNKPTKFGIGTSFSAPMVTGTVALMMQANPGLIGNPERVKAILISSADDTIISNVLMNEDKEIIGNNDVINTASCLVADNTKIESATPILRERSGAGLLNIEAAIRMSNSNLFYEYKLLSGTINSIFTETYYFEAGDTIEFGLVYNKTTIGVTETPNVNDVDIRIFDSANNLVFTSSDYTNNVELFKCTFAESGDYKFTLFSWSVTSPFDVVLFFTCGCNEKMLSHSNFTDAQNTISCSNTECGFSCIEKYRLLQSTKTAYNGITVTLSKYYLPYKIGYSVTGFEQESDLVASYNNTNTSVIVRAFALSYNYSVLTPTGKITTRSYELVLELSDGTIVTTEETFVVTADYFDQTLSIS